jgi:hypothetical protein
MPKKIERIELMGIPGRWGSTDAFGRGLIEVGDSGDEAPERTI